MLVRASSLPLALRCARSVAAGDHNGVLIDEDNDAARIGSAVHEGMGAWCLRGEKPATADLCFRQGLSFDHAEEVGILLACGRSLWEPLKGLFPPDESHAEFVVSFQMHGVLIRGHLDLLRIDGRTAYFIDWKSGRRQDDYQDQMIGYVAGVFASFPDVDQVEVYVAFLRHGVVERLVFTRADVAIFEARVSLLAEESPPYRPGVHCGKCKRRWSCEAHIDMARGSLAVLTREGAPLAELPVDLPPEEAGRWLADKLEFVKHIERACDKAREAIKAEVRRMGGKVPIGEGRALAVVAVEKREVVDSWRAMEIIKARFGDEGVKAVVKIGVGDIDDLVGENAPRGKGKAMRTEMNEALTAAGAMRMVRTEQLKPTLDTPALAPGVPAKELVELEQGA